MGKMGRRHPQDPGRLTVDVALTVAILGPEGYTNLEHVSSCLAGIAPYREVQAALPARTPGIGPHRTRHAHAPGKVGGEQRRPVRAVPDRLNTAPGRPPNG